VGAGRNIIPSALTATLTAVDIGLVEGYGANRSGRRLLLPTTAAGVGCSGAFPIQPDDKPNPGAQTRATSVVPVAPTKAQTEATALSPPLSMTAAGADHARATVWTLPP
jgi:hypothetical protein